MTKQTKQKNPTKQERRIIDENDYMISKASLGGFFLPAVLDAFPELGYVRDEGAILNRPCPTCKSILVNKKDRLGRPRDAGQVSILETGSSLRLLSTPPREGISAGLVPPHAEVSWTIDCLSGTCSYSLTGFSFLELCLGNVGDATFNKRIKGVLNNVYHPLDREYFWVRSGGRTAHSIGNELGALDRLTPGAGVTVKIQVTRGFDEESAKALCSSTGWTEYVTDSEGRLPINWNGGALSTDDKRRLFDIEEAEKRNTRLAIDGKVAAYRRELEEAAK